MNTWEQPWFRHTGGPAAVRKRRSCKLPWMPCPVYRAWKKRIRPDLATSVIPTFPYLTYEAYLQRREDMRNQEIVF